MVPATVLLKLNAPAVLLLQNVWLAGTVSIGVGFTVTVKLCVVPTQVAAVGVTAMIAVVATEPVFTAVNDAILPAPEFTRPIVVLLFVHAYVVPATVLLKLNAPAVLLLQKVWLAGTVSIGVGFTVTVKLWVVPTQVAAVGVTAMIAVVATEPLFTAVKAAILPAPEFTRPIVVLLFVHAYVVPATVLLKLNAPAVLLLQKVWLAGTVSIGVGFTVTVKLCVVPTHVAAVGVTEMIAVVATEPLFTAVNDAILPAPEFTRPIVVLLFVHAYVVPATVLLKLNAPAVLLLQKVWLAGTVSIGVGFTVTVKLCVVPTHVAAVGVTAMIAVVATEPLFTAVKAAILPAPEFTRPIVVLLFVHAYVVPATVLLKLNAPAVLLLHTVWFAGTVSIGVGFTVTVKLWVGPTQVFAEGVTEITAVTATDPLFTVVNEGIGLLVPDELLRPIDVLLLVHV